jgi:hypothetical protein
MSQPRRLVNERTPDDYLLCPTCFQPLMPGQSAGFEEGYAVHVGCKPRPEPGVRRQAGGHRTILCIEDNETDLHLAERLLGERPGVELVTAGHERSGLVLAGERRPHLILLDLHLPDMEGPTSCRPSARTRRSRRRP